MVTVMAAPRFDHLLSMSTSIGTFEHADHDQPRLSHGFCTDDMARVLIVVVREPNPSAAVRDLGRTALRFLAGAQSATGAVRNRRSASGRWHGRPGFDDCWGRAMWAFGTAARHSPEEWMRQSAMAYFDHGARSRSPWRRSMAFAALGAGGVLAGNPGHLRARQLLADAAAVIGSPATDPDWPWPEPRLSYANAALPEALLVAGRHLERPDLVDDGLALLGWLKDRETFEGHLSPTPVGGSGPGDGPPAFDQQPIEVAAMADACATAEAVTGDPGWRSGIELALGWFHGDNDVGAMMFDPATGGGYDGLGVDGPNLNQGAESTLALLSTLQRAVPLTR